MRVAPLERWASQWTQWKEIWLKQTTSFLRWERLYENDRLLQARKILQRQRWENFFEDLEKNAGTVRYLKIFELFWKKERGIFMFSLPEEKENSQELVFVYLSILCVKKKKMKSSAVRNRWQGFSFQRRK